MLKKSVIWIGSSLTLTAPILGTVSCGDSSEKLYVGIRAEDVDFWKSVEEQFEKATGIDVVFQYVSDCTNDYALWYDTGLLPDVAIVDSSASKLGHDEGWFMELDLEDIVENDDYLLDQSLLDDKYKQNKDLELSDEYFSMGMIDSAKIEDSDYYTSYSTIWGPQILYVWTYYDEVDLFDGETDLEWWIPNPDGTGGVIEVTFDDYDYNGDGVVDKFDSPLTKEDGTPYKNTLEDVQEFIMQAGNVNQMKYNGSITKKGFDVNSSTTDEDFVISTGTAGMKQRLNSLSILLKDLSSYALAGGFDAGSSDEPALSYSQIFQGQAPFDDTASTNAAQGTNILDDSKWSSSTKDDNDGYKFQLESSGGEIKADGLSDLTEQLYFSTTGYLDNENIKTSLQLESSDMTVSFGEKQVAMLGGAMWQQASIMDKAGNDSDKIEILALPFQETAVDGYAISSKTTHEEEAKQFLRFLMQENIAAEIASDKAISVVSSAVDLQPESSFKSLAEAIENSGDAGVTNLITDAVIFDNFPYEVAKSSTDNIYDTWNNLLIQTDMTTDAFKLNSGATSLDMFADALDEIANLYSAQLLLTS